MAFEYGFYNSIAGDRKYNATHFGKIFDGIIEDGVFQSIGDKFFTTASTGMDIIVGTGKAWFDHTWNLNTTKMPFTLSASHPVLTRYDTVVMEINESQDAYGRVNCIKIVEGTPSSNAVKPELTNTEYIHQYPLAYIKINPEVTAITAADIEIMVGQDPCPFVTGILETADITGLFANWESQFNTWFDNLKAQLTGDIVSNLQNQIDNCLKNTDLADADDMNAGTEGKVVTADLLKNYGFDSMYKVGDIIETNRTDLSDKWLYCNGEPYDPEEYPELASVLGNNLDHPYGYATLVGEQRTNINITNPHVVVDNKMYWMGTAVTNQPETNNKIYILDLTTLIIDYGYITYKWDTGHPISTTNQPPLAIFTSIPNYIPETKLWYKWYASNLNKIYYAYKIGSESPIGEYIVRETNASIVSGKDYTFSMIPDYGRYKNGGYQWFKFGTTIYIYTSETEKANNWTVITPPTIPSGWGYMRYIINTNDDIIIYYFKNLSSFNVDISYPLFYVVTIFAENIALSIYKESTVKFDNINSIVDEIITLNNVPNYGSSKYNMSTIKFEIFLDPNHMENDILLISGQNILYFKESGTGEYYSSETHILNSYFIFKNLYDTDKTIKNIIVDVNSYCYSLSYSYKQYSGSSNSRITYKVPWGKISLNTKKNTTTNVNNGVLLGSYLYGGTSSISNENIFLYGASSIGAYNTIFKFIRFNTDVLFTKYDNDDEILSLLGSMCANISTPVWSVNYLSVINNYQKISDGLVLYADNTKILYYIPIIGYFTYMVYKHSVPLITNRNSYIRAKP